MSKIAYVECERSNGKPVVALSHSVIAYSDVTGQVAPIEQNTTVYGVWCSDAVAAAIEADPDVLVHTDNNQFLDFDETNPTLYWLNELGAWLNG